MRVYAAARLIFLTATIATGLAANAPAFAVPAAAAAFGCGCRGLVGHGSNLGFWAAGSAGQAGLK